MAKTIKKYKYNKYNKNQQTNKHKLYYTRFFHQQPVWNKTKETMTKCTRKADNKTKWIVGRYMNEGKINKDITKNTKL